MNHTLKRICCTVVAVSLAACGGSSHAGRPAGGIQPLPQPATRSGAQISIKIPHRDDPRAVARYLSNASSIGGRRRHYLSPATQTIGITVTSSHNATTTVNATLSVSAPGSGPNPAECTSTALSTICTITLALSPDTYTGSFTTYDGPLGSNDAPTGNQLSTNQHVPFSVEAGKLNQLVVSLAAIPASVAIVPDASEKLVRGDMTIGYALAVSHFVHKFDVYAQDADGDIIIGPGAPTFTSTVDGTDKSVVSVVDPTASSPNVFTISNSAPLPPLFPNERPFDSSPFDTTLTMTATPTAGAGVTCDAIACARSVGLFSNNVIIAAGGLLGTSGNSAFYFPGEATRILNGGAAISSVADAHGDYFLAGNNFNIYELKPPYDGDDILLFQTPNQGSDYILDLTIDANGTLFFDDAKTIYKSVPPYSSATAILNNFAFDIASEPSQSRLLVDRNGIIIIADNNSVTASHLDATGTPQTIGGGHAAIAIDADDELIVSDASAIASYTYDATSKSYVKAATNTINAGVALRPVRSSPYAVYAVDTAKSRLLEFSLPFSANAPTSVVDPAFADTFDFMPTVVDASVPAESQSRVSGIASVDNADDILTEVYGFDASASRITLKTNGAPGSSSYHLTIIP